jgi:hypothetical protein
MDGLISGINGPVQGKIGTIIGSSRKGIPYVKGPPKVYHFFCPFRESLPVICMLMVLSYQLSAICLPQQAAKSGKKWRTNGRQVEKNSL